MDISLVADEEEEVEEEEEAPPLALLSHRTWFGLIFPVHSNTRIRMALTFRQEISYDIENRETVSVRQHRVERGQSARN